MLGFSLIGSTVAWPIYSYTGKTSPMGKWEGLDAEAIPELTVNDGASGDDVTSTEVRSQKKFFPIGPARQGAPWFPLGW